jgi:CheY-like chemotaxis protein
LFVEDDDDHAELVLRSLEDHDAAGDVFRVADGAAALDYLHHRGAFAEPGSSPTPDIILLDLRLPKVDGLQVLREIKTSEALHRIPVVVLTTSEAESDLARAYDLKANAYVVKPIDFAKLGSLLHDLGLFWLTWNRMPSGAQLTSSGEEPAD